METLRANPLGIELGTSRIMIELRLPSEATSDKRDVVFDLISHKPMVTWQTRIRVCKAR
jgi:hypothetical protein